MRARYFWLLCSCMALSCGQSPKGQDVTIVKAVAMLRKTPSIYKATYRCGEMVQVVNYLRQLGKDESLSALRDYLRRDKEHAKVHVICRLLFVNPKGWDPPMIGTPVPNAKKDIVKRFPLFPMAVADNVPFLLVRGFSMGGMEESAFGCIKLCEDLSLIGKDYSLTGYDKAAKALIKNEWFCKLYEETDLELMEEFILGQAIEPKEEEKTEE